VKYYVEQFEDTKGVIRSRNSKDRQYNVVGMRCRFFVLGFMYRLDGGGIVL